MALTCFVYNDAGVVCDRGLALGDLIGVLNEFFARLGTLLLSFCGLSSL